MAKELLRQLPRIPSYALPSDANCPICLQPYENITTDSGTFEKAVALPCYHNHIFGSECLLAWLAHGQNCPMCRCGIVFPNSDDRVLAQTDTHRAYLTFSLERNQEWDEYWYTAFWILHLRGDRAVEREWQQWQQDWIFAAEEWNRSCQAHARAALSLSRMATRKILDNPQQVRVSAAAMQTLRFREYRLFLSFQADAGEHPELKAPPAFQLTPAQENELFRELDRRQAFRSLQMPAISKREQWNRLRDVGFVWDPNWDTFHNNIHGRWSRYEY